MSDDAWLSLMPLPTLITWPPGPHAGSQWQLWKLRLFCTKHLLRCLMLYTVLFFCGCLYIVAFFTGFSLRGGILGSNRSYRLSKHVLCTWEIFNTDFNNNNNKTSVVPSSEQFHYVWFDKNVDQVCLINLNLINLINYKLIDLNLINFTLILIA